MIMVEKNAPHRTAERPDPPSSPARRHVLIAEDEVLVAWSLAEELRRLGYFVCGTVSTQQGVIEAASRLKPDIILMDYRLDGGDGLTAARKIRDVLTTPIIFCTAYVGDLGSEVRMLSGVQLIAKPVQPAKLEEALARATLVPPIA